MISAYPKAALLAVHLFASVCLVIAGGSACSAGERKAGRTKALMCQACHGLDGLSKTPDAPNIAAQIEPYIVAQLQRINPVRERTTPCRWLRRLYLTRTSRILQLIFRQSKSMSSNCRVDSIIGSVHDVRPTAGAYARFGEGLWSAIVRHPQGSRKRTLVAHSHNLRPRMSPLQILLKKSLLADEPNFSGPLVPQPAAT